MSKLLNGKTSRLQPGRQLLYQHVNTTTTVNTNVLRLFTTSSPDAINYSACICILLDNVEAHTKSVLTNISILQNLFSKTFFVFVINANNKISEITFSKINHSIVIQTYETEEYKQRNLYLKFLHENKTLFDLMVVIDPLTCLITPLNPNVFSFLKSDLKFSACFANQSYKYYDIENLVDDTRSVYLIPDESEKKQQIRFLQKHIHKESGNIPVKSAFGGFAIYKTAYLESDNRYTTDNHITFNLKVNIRDANMFIVSSFIIETSPEMASLYL